MWFILLKICHFLAIVPIWSKPVHFLHQIYSLTVVFYIIFSFFYSIHLKFMNSEYAKHSKVLFLLELLLYVFLSVTVITTIVSTMFVKSKKWKKLLEKLENLNEELIYSHNVPQLCIVFVLLQVMVLITWLYDATVLLSSDSYQHFVSKGLLWCHITTTNIVICTLAHNVTLKFIYLNHKLEKSWKETMEKYRGIRYCKIQSHNRLKISKNFEMFRNYYDTLCDIVDDGNKVLGVTFLFFVLTNIINIVYYIFAFLYFNNWKFWTVGIFWITLSMIQVAIVGVISENMSQQASRTTNLCYILLNDVPAVPKSYYHRLLKDELLQIAEQSFSRVPQMSAARFFDINLAMVGFILASVASYIIVAIELESE